jgi:hypothetical protein
MRRIVANRLIVVGVGLMALVVAMFAADDAGDGTDRFALGAMLTLAAPCFVANWRFLRAREQVFRAVSAPTYR